MRYWEWLLKRSHSSLQQSFIIVAIALFIPSIRENLVYEPEYMKGHPCCGQAISSNAVFFRRNKPQARPGPCTPTKMRVHRIIFICSMVDMSSKTVSMILVKPALIAACRSSSIFRITLFFRCSKVTIGSPLHSFSLIPKCWTIWAATWERRENVFIERKLQTLSQSYVKFQKR